MIENKTNTVQPTMAELQARIDQLQAALATKNNRPITLKVSEKGAVSAYGLGRFPVTLYGTQWDKLLGEAENIKAFLIAHKSELATKPDTTAKA